MVPGGPERSDPGQLSSRDIKFGLSRLDELLARPGHQDRSRRSAALALRDRSLRLEHLLQTDGTTSVVYVEPEVFALQPRLRSTAIEIDFGFGDRDGQVSQADIRKARIHYGRVRGPVGWNRLLVADEIERYMFPKHVLGSSDGHRLVPEDWVPTEHSPPLSRLNGLIAHLEDETLARTYADIAARLGCASPQSRESQLFKTALKRLGDEIKSRDSVRPTISDIARIGCETLELKSFLRTPIDMSRRLSPTALLDEFLD